jgi:hypothetical protein
VNRDLFIKELENANTDKYTLSVDYNIDEETIDISFKRGVFEYCVRMNHLPNYTDERTKGFAKEIVANIKECHNMKMEELEE